jgi:hypothetical protein
VLKNFVLTWKKTYYIAVSDVSEGIQGKSAVRDRCEHCLFVYNVTYYGESHSEV